MAEQNNNSFFEKLNFISTPRGAGKSLYALYATEAALNAGKTVLCVSPLGKFKKRRKGHLTLIEEIHG